VADVEVVADAGGISPKWGAPEMPPKDAPSYGVQSASLTGSSASDEKKGAVVFARACAACHGDHGQGIQEKDETVRTIREPALLGLISNQALRRYVITGRPDLGMPSYAKARPDKPDFLALTDEDVTDLVALLASWRSEK
jgi:cytochrome c